ncbi:FMN-binding protein [Micromonospora sp. M12]
MRRAFLAITGLAASTTALVVFRARRPPPRSPRTCRPPSRSAPPAGRRPERRPVGRRGTEAVGDRRRAHVAKPTKTTSRPSGTKTTTKAAPRTTTKAPSRPTAGSPATASRTSTGTCRCRSWSREPDRRGRRAVAAQRGESDIHSGDVRNSYDGSGGQVVQKQNANLNTVSGATETSNSYKQSLRSAIEQAF